MADVEDLVVIDEQPESQKGKKKKKKKKGQGEASLEGFESWNFQQMSGSIAFIISANYFGFILINADVSCSYDTQHTVFCSFSWPFPYLSWHRHLYPQTAPVP